DSGVTSITSVLPVLSKMLDGPKVKTDSELLPCLALEKDSTGALLLARSEAAVEHILALSRKNQVERRYCPIFRMNEAGDGVTKVRSHRQAHPAVTKYRVLDSSYGCSLIELQPFSG
ncbi:hypothetical protein GOODEAATRI_006085, partial [Goodea atripinnis]